MNRPIFILGATKSGTSVLRNLFDQHPDLFVLPTETHFFQYVTGDWVDYRLRACTPFEIDAPKAILINAAKLMLANNDPKGGGYYPYDLDRFAQSVENYKGTTATELIEAYVEGLYYAMHNERLPHHKRLVEKSVENTEFAFVLKSLFPDASFVHIVRNPYANLVALRRFKSKKPRLPIYTNLLQSLSQCYHSLFRNMRYIENYHVLKYEDLLSDPSITMQALAKKLDIAYTEHLLIPTLNGQPWQGNSSDGKTFRGLSTVPITQWRQQITGYEIYAANLVAAPVFDRFGYERIRSKLPIMPQFIEGPTTYLLNRAALYSYRQGPNYKTVST